MLAPEIGSESGPGGLAELVVDADARRRAAAPRGSRPGTSRTCPSARVVSMSATIRPPVLVTSMSWSGVRGAGDALGQRPPHPLDAAGQRLVVDDDVLDGEAAVHRDPQRRTATDRHPLDAAAGPAEAGLGRHRRRALLDRPDVDVAELPRGGPELDLHVDVAVRDQVAVHGEPDRGAGEPRRLARRRDESPAPRRPWCPGSTRRTSSSTEAIREASTTASRAPGLANDASAISDVPSGSTSWVRSTVWAMVSGDDQSSAAGAAVAATLPRQSAAAS